MKYRIIKHLYLVVILVLLIALSFCGKQETKIEKVESKKTSNSKYFTIGSISKSVRNEATVFLPLAEYIASNLDPTGETVGRVIVAKSLYELADSMNQNLIDIYIDSPFPIIYVNELTKSEISLLHIKRGESEYSSIIFAKKNSGYNSLSDLKGKMIAFDSPFSTSGYLLPITHIISKGFKVQELKDTSATVEKSKIGYIFTYKDDNSFLWVLKNKVAAGATDNFYLDKKAGQHKKEFQIISESEKFPRQLVLMRSSINNSVKRKVKSILLNIHKSKSGREAINQYSLKKRFDVLSEDQLQKLETVKNLISEVNEKR